MESAISNRAAIVIGVLHHDRLSDETSAHVRSVIYLTGVARLLFTHDITTGQVIILMDKHVFDVVPQSHHFQRCP